MIQRRDDFVNRIAHFEMICAGCGKKQHRQVSTAPDRPLSWPAVLGDWLRSDTDPDNVLCPTCRVPETLAIALYF